MKIVLVAGARPNFMKIAPLLQAMRKFNDEQSKFFDPILVHTGQHYDYEMSRIFFEDLELPQPDIYLGVGSGTHAEQTGRIMMEFEKVLFREKPDLVIVVGDVNSTLAATLVAIKMHIPIAHVEAGLYLDDLSLPEEVNRLITDIISDYLFTPSREAFKSVKRKGVPDNRIFFVGNIMVDSLLSNKKKASQRQILSRLGLREKDYGLLTLHRPDNVDDEPTFRRLTSAIREISRRIPIVFPIHPRTQKSIKDFGMEHCFSWLDLSKPSIDKGIYLVDPLGYLDFLNLEMNAKFVLTDSGGMQAETTILNVPCLTLYRDTPWKSTLNEGTNTLVGTEPEKIIKEALKILEGKYKKGVRPELWDGRTGERIVECLAKLK